ncbi:nitroreductase/quinone reductase family protein [Amycolatopsis sp. H20-H5]|uniref:nitroreductase/quinone reductase family protein n=1 Tax=Amycolatopsis sp. H20-H5 TaxID=3046309 RepID=UPI003FA3C53C
MVSGRGSSSDWYRNLEAAPADEVRIGAHTWHAPAHRVLGLDETVRLLSNYRIAHPHLWKRLSPLIGAPRDPDERAWRELAERLRAVAFSPRIPSS